MCACICMYYSNCYDPELMSYEGIPIAIEPGLVLLFEHKLFHEGAELFKGTKYCVRTDVMYSGNDENYNENVDVNTDDFDNIYIHSIGEKEYQSPLIKVGNVVKPVDNVVQSGQSVDEKTEG